MAATTYGTVSGSAQDIINEMNKNSAAWASASAEDQKALHDQNVGLASQLGTMGYSTNYDQNGEWYILGGGNGNTPDSNPKATGLDTNTKTSASNGSLPSATSQDDYIKSYYEAAQQAALDELDSAYQQSLLGLDASAAKIPQQYYTAKNAAASQNAMAKQGFGEYAASSGLNSGAGGQASLAYSNQLQSNLSGLSQAEADALADVETERAKVKAQYQSAVAQAIADNDLQEANALYQEMVRVDDSMVSTAYNQALLDQNDKQLQYQREQDDRSYSWEESQSRKQDAQTVIAQMIVNGLMPGAEYVTASGYDYEAIKQLAEYYKKYLQ